MLRSCRVLFMVQGQAGWGRTATRHRRAREGLAACSPASLALIVFWGGLPEACSVNDTFSATAPPRDAPVTSSQGGRAQHDTRHARTLLAARTSRPAVAQRLFSVSGA